MDFQADDGKNPRPFRCFERGHYGILAREACENGPVSERAGDWIETENAGDWLFAPVAGAVDALVAFSGRGQAPADTPSPTEFLARRLARAAGLEGFPIVRATQVHGGIL